MAKVFYKSKVKMKTWIFILILSCFSVCSFGQANLKGRVTDRQKNLPSATVFLLDSDSALLKEVVTNNDGEFIFENIVPGHYLVSSSIVGYSKFLSPRISVEEKNIILPDIILEEADTK